LEAAAWFEMIDTVRQCVRGLWSETSSMDNISAIPATNGVVARKSSKRKL
jgi:hypothetical protein